MTCFINSAYISTLGSIIEAKEPERISLASLTEQFLNQGGKIKQLGNTTPTDATSPALSPYNKRVAAQKRKKRDSLVEDVVNCLEQGMVPTAIQSKLKINHKAYMKLLKENSLEEFAKRKA